MNEEFLHFIWQNNLLSDTNLVSVEGEKIEILHAGFKNNDAGPDFYDARIRVGEQLWAGTIEIHKKSSDWQKHKHSSDKAYQNVILHVVAEHDKEIKYLKDKNIPTLVLKINSSLYHNYTNLVNSNSSIYCTNFISQINEFYIKTWQNRLLVGRIERKTAEIIQKFNKNHHSWEETFYQILFKNFGFKVNALPFDMLARSLPYKYIQKQKDNLLQIEALLYGQAGFLSTPCNDNYFKLLKREYDFLTKKYEIKPMQKHIWKFLRLRPVNFPTIRIAQLAAILYKNVHLSSTIIETEKPESIFEIFNIDVSNYWQYHYSFCKESKKISKKIGKQAINNLLINTVVAFLFAYGIANHKEKYKEKAMELLEIIPAEKNNITRKWSTIGIKADNAFESQALIELHNQYCKKGKCLECNIGTKIIIRENY